MKLEISSGVYEDLRISMIQEPKREVRQIQVGYLELASSIMRQGLLEPIIVRPMGGKFELVAGSRRLAACRTLGWKKIPCQIVELTDQESFEVALSENIARRTLDPLEEAKAFRDYTEKYGWGSKSELARKIGKSPAYVSRRLGLLTLPEGYLDQLFRRRKNPSLAEEINALEDEELKAHLINLASELHLTSKEVRRLGKSLKHEDIEGRVDWLGQHQPNDDERYRSMRSSIRRVITALRLALNRLDGVIENVDEENWILKEILLEQRIALHSQIDLVSNLTRRVEKITPSW